MDYHLNFRVIWDNFDHLLAGLGLGLGLAVISLLLGSLIGLIAAFARLSHNPIWRGVATIYVTTLRNTPLLVLIFFTYFALPQMGLRLGKVESFVFTLTLYSGAYLTEVFRGGLLAVSTGLREAGLAVGLSEWQVKYSIVIPVLLRNVLPSLSNNFISLFKDTSLAAAIAVPELTYYARKINVETFRVIETWLVASILYVAACYLIAYGLRFAEHRLATPR